MAILLNFSAMAFIDKMKTMFNIGVDVEFPMETQLEKNKGFVEGKVKLTTTTERKFRKVQIRIDQHIKKNNGSVDIVTIGKVEYPLDITLKTGEDKMIDFKIHFDAKDNWGDKVAEKVGTMGGVLGMVGNYAANQRNWEKTYTLKVTMDIEGALWKPEEATGVKLL